MEHTETGQTFPIASKSSLKEFLTRKFNFSYYTFDAITNKDFKKIGFEKSLYLFYKTHTAYITLSIPDTLCQLRFTYDPSDLAIKAAIAMPPVALWFKYSNPYFSKLISKAEHSKRFDNKEIGFSIHNESIYWTTWTDPHRWSNQDPKWLQGSFNFTDFFLGKEEHLEKEISMTQNISIPMPEHNYKCNVIINSISSKRPRWFGKNMLIATVHIPDGIPFPSKHSNDDACFSMSCPASNTGEAIGAVVKNILNERWRRGRQWEYLAPQDIKLKNILQ